MFKLGKHPTCTVFQEGPQRKKRKSEAVHVEEKADLLAMGTAAGTVLIYSTAKGALHCTLVSLKIITLLCVLYFIFQTKMHILTNSVIIV